MCLGIALNRPGDVLNKGVHCGFEWMVIHNTYGYRCGYVRIPKTHPWYGESEPPVDVHGGITFSEFDVPCDKGGADDGWWLGFDCAHGGDAPDPELPSEYKPWQRIAEAFPMVREVRTQEYAEGQCKSLCEQASRCA
jgi:hypothetical protein